MQHELITSNIVLSKKLATNMLVINVTVAQMLMDGFS